MKTFRYKAKQGPQKVVEGEMQAENRDQVASRLSGQGLFPLEITASGSSGTESLLSSASSAHSFTGKVTLREKISFIDQLADLSSAGLSIMRALDVISKQPRGSVWNQLLGGIKHSIQSGKGFSDALESYPSIFSPFIISMIRAGETGGSF